MIKHIINIRKKQKPGEPTAAGVSGFFAWQGRRDSNTQPAVLETAALPLSHSPKREDNHSIAAGCCQSGKIRSSLLITVKCLLKTKGVARRRVALSAETARFGARGRAKGDPQSGSCTIRGHPEHSGTSWVCDAKGYSRRLSEV